MNKAVIIRGAKKGLASVVFLSLGFLFLPLIILAFIFLFSIGVLVDGNPQKIFNESPEGSVAGE